jgi:hypothetical protein
MNHYELFLYWLTLGLQILLCALVYIRKIERRLPFFAIYASLLAAGALGTQFVYHHFGFRSAASYYAAWITTGVHVVARSFAIGELCRNKLRAYKGIWGITWRALTFLAMLFLGHAAIDAWGQPDRIAIYGLTMERDVAITSVVVLLAMLLIRNYYGLSLDPMQKWIATGICFFCIVDVVNNTILRDAFTGYLFPWFFTKYASSWSAMRSQVESANELWSAVRASAFVVSVCTWCFALLKPLPAPAWEPVLLPTNVYAELSPALNLSLRAFNDRLLELLRS